MREEILKQPPDALKIDKRSTLLKSFKEIFKFVYVPAISIKPWLKLNR